MLRGPGVVVGVGMDGMKVAGQALQRPGQALVRSHRMARTRDPLPGPTERHPLEPWSSAGLSWSENGASQTELSVWLDPAVSLD
jgi:hypothetical protein